MASLSSGLSASKTESTLLVLFIPSVDRDETPVDQDSWVARALETLGHEFGGATAFPKARGVWRDDARGGRLVFDEPVVGLSQDNGTPQVMLGQRLTPRHFSNGLAVQKKGCSHFGLSGIRVRPLGIVGRRPRA